MTDAERTSAQAEEQEQTTTTGGLLSRIVETAKNVVGTVTDTAKDVVVALICFGENAVTGEDLATLQDRGLNLGAAQVDPPVHERLWTGVRSQLSQMENSDVEASAQVMIPIPSSFHSIVAGRIALGPVIWPVPAKSGSKIITAFTPTDVVMVIPWPSSLSGFNRYLRHDPCKSVYLASTVA